MKTTKQEKINKIEQSVLQRWISRNGDASTVKEIAEDTGISVGTINKYLREDLLAVSYTQKDIACKEYNYGTTRCFRPVTAFKPYDVNVIAYIEQLQTEVHEGAKYIASLQV